jgi:Mce-associated membrane protein
VTDPDQPFELDAAGGDARRQRPVLTGLLAVILVAATAAAGYGSYRLFDAWRDGGVEQSRIDALTAARQEALNLIAVDGTDTDADIAAVLAGATGAFKADFTSRSADLKRVITGAKVTSSDLKVVDAAIVRADEQSATVIVAADSIVKNAAKPDGSPRTYRMLLELELAGGRWLTSSLEVVG